MKVRMKIDISGLRGGQKWPRRGEVLDCSDIEGAELCAQGYAEPVKQAARTRVAEAPENTAKPRGKAKEK